MTNYTLDTYKKLLRTLPEEEKRIKIEMNRLMSLNIFDIGSTSIATISSNYHNTDKTLHKILKKDDIEKNIESSKIIKNTILETVYNIDINYRNHVVDIYARLNKGKKNYALHEAEKFGYDHRVFAKKVDKAMIEALSKPETKKALNKVYQHAIRTDRKDLIEIFEETPDNNKNNN